MQALDGVGLQLAAGEVLAVVGENGAGKSTLMKILAGIYPPDNGTLLLEGRPVHFTGVADALRHGINLIHQELNLAENLSVAANLYLGREICHGGPLGLLDQRDMTAGALRLMERVGLRCSPAAVVGDLPPGQRQLVEVARALGLQARILIMDEPTSSLTQAETERLFDVVADLKRGGVAVVYISHRLAEVQRVADRVTVLRDGRNAGELQREQISHAALVRLMVGRDLQQFFKRQHAPPSDGQPRLEVRDLRWSGMLSRPHTAQDIVPETAGAAKAWHAAEGISLVVRAGEIVGMAGLVGAGRTELAEALFGVRPVLSGQVLLDGQAVTIRHPRQAIAAGLVLVPEDRRLHGLVLEDTVRHNVSLPNLGKVSTLGLIMPARETALTVEARDRLQVRTPSLEQVVGLLSGGNQQKVVLGKWLARQPRVLIFDEPTRGIDVGAKSEIYALMDRLAGEGAAILMISSDLEELLGMSDRVLVLHQGRLAGELTRAELSEEAIMHLATGGARPS